METESRTAKTFLNARVNTIFYVLQLLLSFFSRKVFLDCLGAEFVGLTTTLQNLLGYLNLAELGVGTAIGYVLYKPLFDKDQQKINEIISVMGYIYRWIGLIIGVAGFIMSLFLPIIFADEGFEMSLVFFAFYSFLTSSLIGYFINYRQNLLGADQKNYVVTAYFQTGNIIKILTQMAVVYKTSNFYIWIAIELVWGIIYSIILNWKINKTYPWLNADVKLGKAVFKKYPEVIKYTKQLFVHKIAYSATCQSHNILIYAFVSLKTVAYYGNYTIIIDKLWGLLYSVLGSANAGIGNLVAQGDIRLTNKTFWEMNSLNCFVGGIFIFGVATLAGPFIEIWLGEEYVLPLWMITPMFAKHYCDFTTSNLGTFCFAHGLFYDVWAPIVESVICLVISVVGGYYWGLFGVLLGSAVSNIIINLCWKSYFLFRKGLKSKLRYFWISFFTNFLMQAASAVVAYYFASIVYPTATNFIELLIRAVVMVGTYTILSGIMFFFFGRGFKDLSLRMFSLLKNRIWKK